MGKAKKRKKSKAQIFLERVEMAEAAVHGKLVERQQWRELALSITANMGGERVQSSASTSRMADAVDKCVDMEAEVDREIDRLIDIKREATETLEQLDNPFDYRILHMKYIQYKTLEVIAEELGKSYTSITTAHGRALARVKKILNGGGVWQNSKHSAMG